jgi:hypothetical protein
MKRPLLLSLLLLAAAALPAAAQGSLANYTALRFCAYRLDGLSPTEAEAAALADLNGRYYALIGNQLPAIRAALPGLSRQACPEAFPNRAGSQSTTIRLRAGGGACTPTVNQTRQAAAGQRLSLNDGPGCQIQLN